MHNNGDTVFHSSNSGVIKTNVDNKENNIPNNYKSLSPWAYFGYSLLFGIPLIGFILLIIFSFNNSNINRRNFARSYWCSFLFAIIIIFVTIAVLFALGIKLDIHNIQLPINI